MSLQNKIQVVYDGLVQGQVYQMAQSLNLAFCHIKEYQKTSQPNEKLFLLTRSVKFGEVSEEAKSFLAQNNSQVIGVAVSGNKTWGTNYGKAGDIIASTYNIPLVLKFEGSGLKEERDFLKDWLTSYHEPKKPSSLQAQNNFTSHQPAIKTFNPTKVLPPWIILNNQIIDEKGNIKDLDKDQEALISFLSNEVKPKLKRFDTLKEKLNFLQTNEYYETTFLSKYNDDQIKTIYQIAYQKKFRFSTFMGAFKFYHDYALKTRDKKFYLETYEDRLSVNALYHAQGNFEIAKGLIKSLINQDFTPATPTLLNTGKKHRGEFVSCFLLEASDSLNDIARINEFSMQLSKIGGGVSINITNLRAKGESIKGIKGVCKGVVGVCKLLDHSFRYADQMGQRTGAGATYLNVFHADIEDFLSTKKLNADEDVRVKTLSLGVIIPDKMIELARKNEVMYTFYPHTVFLEYKKNFADIAVDMDYWYDILVKNPKVRKKAINPRQLLELIAHMQGESGYPYLMFCDNVNKTNPLDLKIKFSNLCTEILQPTITSHYANYNHIQGDQIGMDVSCNLSSGHMENMINNNTIKETVFMAMEVMNSVSTKTNIDYVPAVAKANRLNRSVGFGIMGHHSFLVKNYIDFGSEENKDLLDVFFNAINYYSLLHSCNKARQTGQKFYRFQNSHYADGSYFRNRGEILPKTQKIKKIFSKISLPSQKDWQQLEKDVKQYGLFNSHRLAVAPNGSIGYIMGTTPSLTPVKQLVEERTYGNSKTYCPMPGLKEAAFMYITAYKMNKYKLIDVIATAQKHVDQGISFELGITSDITTRELQRYYLYAHHKGIKTLYYTRTQKLKVDECEACGV
ncbi:class 1b ribonucleoside-diphosphate reductase subunit alpha [Candidatus Phytoplasma solani]|uniref:Ribonucleoside-diphosphate reductase n=1 Tax=Candidatus Phytoplasma solani TaxID=69896 RepID=A0A421NXS3_9MOLU|nr:class 1b ribonucleoside-diphosphate reductase subunit alpha [Candidatus Phytoplasma solani]RMI88827.1 ribonucleoside-diphosphate reductase alpha chain [Candidatus Phytoplasma solani]CCP88254.1 Ribonucleotide reductase, alpha subunit [Candidatus Phytoplasma solani]CCP88794.1 Ribonucleoside-diphosphate reductase [Candidatus Phytoplasma solani]